MGPSDIACHTEPFCKAAGSQQGFDGMMLAAKGLTVVACEYLLNEDFRKAAWTEFEETRK